MDFFSGGSCSPPPPAKNPFRTGPSLNNNKPYGGGRFYYGKKPNNRNRHSAQYGGKQNNKWHNRFSDKKISGSKPGSLVQKISRIDSRRISNKFSPFSKTFVYRKNPKLAIRKNSDLSCRENQVCEICLVGKSLRASLPLFWISACSQDIFKTIKGTNSSTEAAEHSSSDISPQYSADGKNIRGIFNESRLLLYLGFVINLKKSVLKPSQQIESLGLKIGTHIMSVALTEEKTGKVTLKFQNLLSHPQTTVLE